MLVDIPSLRILGERTRVLHGQLIGNLSDDRRLRIASPTKMAKSAEIGSMSQIR